MQTRKPERTQPHSHEHNRSMSDRDKQKTVANPSPGSADPGKEDNGRVHDGAGTRRH